MLHSLKTGLVNHRHIQLQNQGDKVFLKMEAGQDDQRGSLFFKKTEGKSSPRKFALYCFLWRGR